MISLEQPVAMTSLLRHWLCEEAALAA
jgi:hypothetical protein